MLHPPTHPPALPPSLLCAALIPPAIFHSLNNLVAPNANDAAAVDARQEIDLRIGSSFTRFQTLLLQVGRARVRA
jgi:DNA topoisomerase IA